MSNWFKDVNTEFLVELSTISKEERNMLRPMAETLAMLDGNAFFGVDTTNKGEWWEQYTPEAKAIFDANGGLTGWAGEASFVKGYKE